MKPGKLDFLYVILQFILFALFIFPFVDFRFQVPELISIPALFISGFGIVLCLISLIQLNKNLTPFPTPKSSGRLIQNGVYAKIRHPIYTGIILCTIFFGIFQGSSWRIVAGLLLWILFEFKSRYEEQKLSQKFDEYRNYISKTGRFFPF